MRFREQEERRVRDARVDRPEILAPVNTYPPSLEVHGWAADTKDPWELVWDARGITGARETRCEKK